MEEKNYDHQPKHPPCISALPLILNFSAGNKHAIALQLGGVLALFRLGLLEQVETVTASGFGTVSASLWIQAAFSFSPPRLAPKHNPWFRDLGKVSDDSRTSPSATNRAALHRAFASILRDSDQSTENGPSEADVNDQVAWGTQRTLHHFGPLAEKYIAPCSSSRTRQRLVSGSASSQIVVSHGALRRRLRILQSVRKKFMRELRDDATGQLRELRQMKETSLHLPSLPWPAWVTGLLQTARDFVTNNLEHQAWRWFWRRPLRLWSFVANAPTALAAAFAEHPTFQQTPLRGAQSVAFLFGGERTGSSPDSSSELDHLVLATPLRLLPTGNAPLYFCSHDPPATLTPLNTRYVRLAPTTRLCELLPPLTAPSKFGEWGLQNERVRSGAHLVPFSHDAVSDVFTRERMQTTDASRSRERVLLLDAASGTKFFHRLNAATKAQSLAFLESLGNITPPASDRETVRPPTFAEQNVAAVGGAICSFANQHYPLESLTVFQDWLGDQDVHFEHISPADFEACVNWGFLSALLTWGHRDDSDVKLANSRGEFRGPPLFLDVSQLARQSESLVPEAKLFATRPIFQWDPWWTLPFPQEELGHRWISDLVHRVQS